MPAVDSPPCPVSSLLAVYAPVHPAPRDTREEALQRPVERSVWVGHRWVKPTIGNRGPILLASVKPLMFHLQAGGGEDVINLGVKRQRIGNPSWSSLPGVDQVRNLINLLEALRSGLSLKLVTVHPGRGQGIGSSHTKHVDMFGLKFDSSSDQSTLQSSGSDDRQVTARRALLQRRASLFTRSQR